MTSRALTASMLTEIAAGQLSPVLMYEGEFVSGWLRLWSGYGDIVWNGHTWTGAGSMLEITPIEETTEVRAAGVRVRLSGINTSVISIALSECRVNKHGRVYFGCLDSNGVIVSDPFTSFSGLLDVPVIEENPGNMCDITVTYESRLIDMQRPRERRFTDADQKIDYSTDRGFEFVASLVEKDISWGGKKAKAMIQDPQSVAKVEAAREAKKKAPGYDPYRQWR